MKRQHDEDSDSNSDNCKKSRILEENLALKREISELKKQADELLQLININKVVDDNQNTSLHIACSNNDLESAKLLIANEADINAINKNGDTAFELAYRFNCLDVIKFLITTQADFGFKNINNILHSFCEKNNLDIVELLIKNKVDIESKDIYGNTALHVACMGDDFKMVELLVKNKANIAATNENKDTPLHIAAFNESLEVSAFLMKNGARINVENNEQETPALYINKNKDFVDKVLEDLENNLLEMDFIKKEAYPFLASVNRHNFLKNLPILPKAIIVKILNEIRISNIFEILTKLENPNQISLDNLTKNLHSESLVPYKSNGDNINQNKSDTSAKSSFLPTEPWAANGAAEIRDNSLPVISQVVGSGVILMGDDDSSE